MPKLHYFNPGHETAVLNGSLYYMPPSNTKRMMIDLAYLPAWYGEKDDLIIITKELDRDFIGTLANIQTKLPQTFIPTPDAINKLIYAYDALPWGISPQSIYYFETIFKDSPSLIKIPVWRTEYRALCSRECASQCLKELIKGNTDINPELQPILLSDIKQAKKIIYSQKHTWIIKAPFSSSGRGLLWIYDQSLTIANEQWIASVIKKQGYISLEKAIDKQLDFAMEFFSDGFGGITFHGLSLFETGDQGEYLGNYLGSQSNIYAKLTTYIAKKTINDIKDKLIQIINMHYGRNYTGYLGVDMMIYKTKDQIYHIHPCVEINMRYTMGLVALELSKRLINCKSEGSFSITYSRNHGETLDEHLRMKQKYPAEFIAGRMTSGYFSLCPIDKETQYNAYILIK